VWTRSYVPLINIINHDSSAVVNVKTQISLLI